MRNNLIVLAVTVLLTVTSLALFARPALAVPHIVNGFVGPVDASGSNPANAGSAVLFMYEDAAAPILVANYTASDGIDSAYFDADVGSSWPVFDGNTAIAVIETVRGVNGWAATNYTTSTDGVMSDLNTVESLPASNLEALPILALSFGVDWVRSDWTGLADTAGNVVSYAVFDSGNPVGTVTHAGAGPHSFNDTALAAGTYCYQIGVNYARDALGGVYLGAARSEDVCQALTANNPPEATSTTPTDGAINVPLNQDLGALFSEPMQVGASIETSPSSAVYTPTLDLGDTRLTVTHALFRECVTYTAWANGTDTTGLAVVPGPVPNPWTFDTVCVPPTILSRSPSIGEANVDPLRSINVTFTEPMAIGTVTVETSPSITFSLVWSVNNDFVEASHTTPFTGCQQNWVWVNGTDLAGQPLGSPANRWAFNPFCSTPYIASTSPADGEVGVLLNAVIRITFSEVIVITTCTFTVSPVVAFTIAWNPVNDVANLTPASLAANQTYTVTVTLCEDVDANVIANIGAPNPFDFTTETPSTPTVIVTEPVAGTALAGLSPGSVVFSLTDDMPVADLMVYVNYTSSGGNGEVVPVNTSYSALNTLAWAVPCLNATDVLVIVTAFDAGGASGSDASDPFVIDCAAPLVSSTDPADDEGNVPVTADILVTFSEPMNETSTEASFSAVPAIPAQAWQLVGSVLTITHGALTPQTDYIVTIAAAEDLAGNAMAAGYTFNFTTTDLIPGPPTGVSVAPGSPAHGTLIVAWNRPLFYTSGDPLPGGVAVTYTVFRAASATAAGTEVETGLAGLTFSDTGLQPSTTYHYYVTATVNSRTSAPSNRDSGGTSAAPQPPSGDILPIVVAVILVIVALLALLLFLRRRKKPEAPAGEAPTPGEEAPPSMEGTPPPPPEAPGEAPPSPDVPPEDPPKDLETHN